MTTTMELHWGVKRGDQVLVTVPWRNITNVPGTVRVVTVARIGVELEWVVKHTDGLDDLGGICPWGYGIWLGSRNSFKKVEDTGFQPAAMRAKDCSVWGKELSASEVTDIWNGGEPDTPNELNLSELWGGGIEMTEVPTPKQETVPSEQKLSAGYSTTSEGFITESPNGWKKWLL